jgi:hypothetical protein
VDRGALRVGVTPPPAARLLRGSPSKLQGV